MKIHLKSVEFWREVRGPGPRNQSDVTATYTTHKVKAGEKESTPTGLTIVWDQEARAVYVLKANTSDDPAVIIEWSNVRRAIPAEGDFDWMYPGRSYLVSLSASAEPKSPPAEPKGRVLA